MSPILRSCVRSFINHVRVRLHMEEGECPLRFCPVYTMFTIWSFNNVRQSQRGAAEVMENCMAVNNLCFSV